MAEFLSRRNDMWKAQPINDHTGWVEIMDGDTYIGATRGPNSERNAQIMAAGEELLEALRNILLQYKTVHGIGDMEMQSAIDFAHKAIAKAEGKGR